MPGEYGEGVPLPINPKAEADIHEALAISKAETLGNQDLPKAFATNKSPWDGNVLPIAAGQMSNARDRIASHQDNPKAIGDDYPLLKGHEGMMLEVAKKVAGQKFSDAGEESKANQEPHPSTPPTAFADEEEWDSASESEAARKFDELGEKARKLIEDRARKEQERLLALEDSLHPSSQTQKPE